MSASILSRAPIDVRRGRAGAGPGRETEAGDGAAALVADSDAALRRGDYATAVVVLGGALSVRPDDVRLLVNLGGALKELGRFEEARPVLLRAVALDPRRFAAWSNLGTVQMELQRYDEAVAAFSNAIRLRTDHVPALAGLGVTLRRSGRPEQARTFLDLAVAADPANPDLRTWRAMAALAAGDYPRGFAEYEWRLHASNVRASLPNAPTWKGEPLGGRTVLVHGEGGLGDCLQFARYLPLLRARGGRVVVQMPAPLVRLMARLPGVDAVVSNEAPAPAYDLACPVMSLPYAFGTTVETVPFAGGYLEADQTDLAAWRTRLDADLAAWRSRTGRAADAPGPLRVGLVWSGGKRPWHLENTLMDRRRSMRLADLAPLGAAGGDVLFYSLQLGDPGPEAAAPPPGLDLVDHTNLIADFADTAALVSHLDLVIAVDTSTAHLAGALGRPVWLLSRFDRCWRWMCGRDDSPWYETMRILAQPAPFDWTTPILQASAALARSVDDRIPKLSS